MSMLISFQMLCSQGRCGLAHAARSAKTSTAMKESASINLRTPGRLPQTSQFFPEHVPVNEHGQRLEYYTKNPSRAVRQAFNDKFPQGKKPCMWFQRTDGYKRWLACLQDHSELSPNFLEF